jgi:hypothetical protein
MRIAASAIERGRDDMETFGTELRKRGSYIDELRVAKKDIAIGLTKSH